MDPNLFLSWLRWAIDRVGPGYFGFVERVFCYELYHLIRVLMFKYEQNHGYLGNIFLHSELTKTVVDNQTAQVMGIYPLAGRLSPDLILHEPGTADNQIAVVEVKTAPNLNCSQLIRDFEKLTELSRNYRFHKAVFLSINNSILGIRDLILRTSDRAKHLEQSIIIMAKAELGAPLEETTLAELLLNNALSADS